MLHGRVREESRRNLGNSKMVHERFAKMSLPQSKYSLGEGPGTSFPFEGLDDEGGSEDFSEEFGEAFGSPDLPEDEPEEEEGPGFRGD